MSMKIEHVAVYFKDLERGKEFFENYFGATAGELYHNPRTGFSSYFLSFADGPRLEVMEKAGVRDEQKEPERTGYAHIAFSVGSKEEVDRLTAQLKGDGHEVLSGPRTTGDGYYESCILGPEDIRVEITE